MACQDHIPVIQPILILEIIERRLPGCHSGRTVTYNINNDLTFGKGTIADLERFNIYFRKVLEVAIPEVGSGRRFSTQSSHLATANRGPVWRY